MSYSTPLLVLGDRPPPYSSDMEKAVLSCFLCWPQELDMEFTRLRDDDFYIPGNCRIFQSLSEMHKAGKVIDLFTFVAKLESKDQLEDVGGIDTLRDIMNAVPHPANFESYLTKVQEDGRARRLINVCTSVVGKLYESDANVTAIVSEAETEIIKVSNEGTVRDVKYVRDCVPAAKKQILGMYEKDPDTLGIDPGYKVLNEMLTGLKGGKTYIFAARPSIGKTTFLLNLLSRVASVEKGVFFSLEMTETECTEKLISLFGSIDPNDVYSESIEYESLLQQLKVAEDKLQHIDLIIDDTSYYFEDLVHRIKMLYVKERIKYAAIDYLQLMSMIEKSDNREQMVSKMSSQLKRLAKALDIPIIILAQLNRGAEARQPLISDLRDSGAIEQDADVVALIHRDRADSQEQRDRVEQGHALETKIIISKNRGGKTGPFDLWFFPQFSNFSEPTRVKDEDIRE